MQNPDRYVLKPQREGGGNNLYGQDLVGMLRQGLAAGGGEGLAAFILMQRIVPPPQRSVFVRAGAWTEDESLSELGIYGTFLKVGQQVGEWHGNVWESELQFQFSVHVVFVDIQSCEGWGVG
jgi:glutathione synthase